METRNITITLEKAIELYNSDNESLKDLALQAFSKEDLMHNFRDITSFKKACDALNICKDRDAIEAGVVLTKEAKQKIMEILKENTEPRLFH